MTSRDFQKQLKKIVEKYGEPSGYLGYQYEMTTMFGKFYFTSEYDGRAKSSMFHSRFVDMENIDLFKEWIEGGRSLSTFTHKFNFYYKDPEFMLSEIEELLSNLVWMTEGKYLVFNS